MKKLSLITLSLIVILLVSCKPSQKNAAKFNDQMVEEHFEILKLEYDLINSIFYTDDDSEISSFISDYQSKLKTKLEKLEKIKPFDKEDDLRLSLISLIKSMIEISENEYTELAQILANSTEEDFENEILANRLTKLTESIDLKSELSNKAFLNAQSQFANRYDITLR